MQVYVLTRDRRGCPAEKRLLRLLHSGLFHVVRDDPALRAKVVLLKVAPSRAGGARLHALPIDDGVFDRLIGQQRGEFQHHTPPSAHTQTR